MLEVLHLARIKVLPGECVCHGAESLFAVYPTMAAPIGHIHFRQFLANHVEILDCYVMPVCRRRGVLTLMFTHLRL